jgi:hypothetical protein
MTEVEWLACVDPSQMLAFLEGMGCGSNRKLRLFAVACCRRIWSGLQDERSRAAVEAAERFADGQATQVELRAAFTAAYAAVDDCRSFSPSSEYQAIAAFLTAARCITESVTKVPENEDANEVAAHVWSFAIDGKIADNERQQLVLLRDISGNPFRPVSFSLEWRTDTALSLARQMYESRDFSAMPILADALQDAGCDSDDVLNHCRGPGPHVRGCWVVDLVLGKE